MSIVYEAQSNVGREGVTTTLGTNGAELVLGIWLLDPPKGENVNS
jgi:hypothetical protein